MNNTPAYVKQCHALVKLENVTARLSFGLFFRQILLKADAQIIIL